MREYAVIFEKTETGWSAYAPDLPGLGVVGGSFEEIAASEKAVRSGQVSDHHCWRGSHSYAGILESSPTNLNLQRHHF